MTWDHPRGYDPLAAASRVWAEMGGETIEWDRRSLQDFESYPVEELARRYDLIVIDHPHVGQVADAGCLAALEELCDAVALSEIAAGSVGGSFESYNWSGHQWALPIDAAAQVQAWVPGRIETPLRDWDTVIALAKQGRLTIPLRPPHSLMSLFTLIGLAGGPLSVDGDVLFPEAAHPAYDRLAEFAVVVDPLAYEQDPIAVLEAMAQPDSKLAVSPLIYGYVSYSLNGFRPQRIGFADLAAWDPRGSALGGTGIAVSAFGETPERAAAFAAWVASGTVQRSLYALSGGQPAHADAWVDNTVNALVADFYIATRKTLDSAWLRPRHDGYMTFQHAASERLNQSLRSGETAASAIAALNALYRDSK
ncbi:extracellular solute-binding protein [Sphingomonas sp. JC676]|uniref:extracellular solute-binding protein n=1 Tax=Sphingomonas sp. JC676 TaxID=2768065 RepID=UPI001657DC4C|nr:extracellular solute-binding protein [Sphingomonas sp. JC676]MBC9031985.1 extracellular solute-binding protein [Sphingomonas sp. JC676]